MINGEDKLLTAQNKWLIAHEETQIPGAFCGLVGEKLLDQMSNMPKVKIEIVAVSKIVSPESLSVNRRIYLPNILKDQKCSLQQQRKEEIIC